MFPTLKAALFDLDGTLFDTEGHYSQFWSKVGQRYHPEINDFAQLIKGTTLSDIMQRYFPDKEMQQDLIRQLYEAERNVRYHFFPGAEEMLHDLRNHGMLLALVTSSNRDKMRHVQMQMPHFPQLFDQILTAEDFAHSKPHPDCYLRAAERLACTPAECIVFEDAFSGLQAAMTAGMFTFGMATTHPRQAIETRCSHVLDSFQGINYQSIIHILKTH